MPVIFKFSKDGVLLWKKKIDRTLRQKIYGGLYEEEDNTLVLVLTWQHGTRDYDIGLIKLSADTGEKIWGYVYGSNAPDSLQEYPFDIAQTEDKSAYIITSFTTWGHTTPKYSALVSRIDRRTLLVDWATRIYTNSEIDLYMQTYYTIGEMEDGSILIGGLMFQLDGRRLVAWSKLSPSGEYLWTHSLDVESAPATGNIDLVKFARDPEDGRMVLVARQVLDEQNLLYAKLNSNGTMEGFQKIHNFDIIEMVYSTGPYHLDRQTIPEDTVNYGEGFSWSPGVVSDGFDSLIFSINELLYYDCDGRNNATTTTKCRRKCFEYDSEDPMVCSGHGGCEYSDYCSCSSKQDEYFNGDCSRFKCLGIENWGTNVSDICSTHGSCVDTNECECSSSDYYGPYCNVTTCFTDFSNISSTCTNYGECWPKDKCTCQNGYYGTYCNISECNGILSNYTSQVCHQKGIYWPFNNCSCEGGYFGEDCEFTFCEGKPSNVPSSVCNEGNGICWPFDTCTCSQDYFGVTCNITTCSGVFSNSTEEVCNGHGRCSSYEKCECTGIYSGSNCTIFEVYVVTPLENQEVKVNDTVRISIPISSFHGDDFISLSTHGKPEWMIQNESPPSLVSAKNTRPVFIRDFAKYGDYLFVAESGVGYSVFNNKNKSNPILVKEYSNVNPKRILIEEGTPIMFMNDLISETIVVLNITDPESINVLGKSSETLRGTDGGLDKEGDRLYVTDFNAGVRIFNISNTSNPFEIDSFVAATTVDVKVRDEIAYLAVQDSPGLKVLDVSDPNNTALLGQTSAFGANSVVLKGNYAFTADFNLGLRIISIENSSSPYTIATNATNPKCGRLSLGGPGQTYVFTTDEAATTIFDVSNVYAPKKKFIVGPTSPGQFAPVLADRNYFFTDRAGGAFNTYDLGSISLEGDVPFEECGKTYTIRVKVDSDVGNQLNTTFEVSVNGEGFGNIYDRKCTIFVCDSILSNDTANVCNGRGNCTFTESSKNGLCECEFPFTSEFCKECVTGYYGENCDVTTCNGHFSNDSAKVCSNHGDCWSYESCRCSWNYYGDDCSVWGCHGTFNNETDRSSLICSSHGVCVEHDHCECINQYSGDWCQYWSCWNISTTEVDKVCGGHGGCIALDICGCQSGYSPSSGEFGDICDFWECEEYSKDDPMVCNQKGSCIGVDDCECVGDFTGSNCETWKCNGVFEDDSGVCSGNGVCESPNECVCESQFSGDDCSTNLYLFTIMAPILFVSGVTGVVFVGLLICICLCCTCILISFVVCLVCCICICGFCVLGLLMCSQASRISKFRQLKDFELLLHEQKMEADTSVAHIKVNKNLFEIAYDDLVVESILGEGGSDSTVYKCNWKGKIVAFKCFKTRLICQTQDRFDEFEREVEVMSSIAHPSIVRFFGCTMKPPRVGIVMELCENGELLEFFEDFLKEKSRHYDIKEKVRILHEISMGMEYLHSRQIIHRDLKSQNVLIDRCETPKIMDFGLSKIAARMSQAKTTRVGTCHYMAPEVVLDAKYTEKCDVFSYAILCFVAVTESESIYSGEEQVGIELRVASSPDFRPDVEDMKKFMKDNGGEEFMWLLQIVQSAWLHDPKQRPSFRDINEMILKRGEVEKKADEKEVQEKEEDEKDGEVVVKDDTEKSKEELLEEVKILRGETDLLRRKTDLMEKDLEFYRLRFDEVVPKNPEEEEEEVEKSDSSDSSSTNSSEGNESDESV